MPKGTSSLKARKVAGLESGEAREETKRIQFEFSAKAVERLNKMRDMTDTGSYAELVRNALRVYEYLIDQEQAGYEFGLVKDDTLVKVVKFFFEQSKL